MRTFSLGQRQISVPAKLKLQGVVLVKSSPLAPSSMANARLALLEGHTLASAVKVIFKVKVSVHISHQSFSVVGSRLNQPEGRDSHFILNLTLTLRLFVPLADPTSI